MKTLNGINYMWSDAGNVDVYVASAPVIEHVSPQPLHTNSGRNTITVEAEIDNILFDIKYFQNPENPATSDIVGIAEADYAILKL